MTTFLLVRHAAHTLGGDVLAGRTPGVHLSIDPASMSMLALHNWGLQCVNERGTLWATDGS